MTTTFKKLPSAAYLSSYVDYNPLTGIFTWAVRPGFARWNATKAGKRADTVASGGYREIIFPVGRYRAHRVALKMAMGDLYNETLEVDHRNGQRDDNRLTNLRSCTRSQNLANRPAPARPVHRSRGVYLRTDRVSKPYEAYVYFTQAGQPSKRFLGYYATEPEAAAVAAAARAELHGEFMYRDRPTQH